MASAVENSGSTDSDDDVPISFLRVHLLLRSATKAPPASYSDRSAMLKPQPFHPPATLSDLTSSMNQSLSHQQ